MISNKSRNKYLTILIIIATTLFSGCGNKKNETQELTSRLIGTEVPHAGEKLELTYKPKGGPLEGKDTITAVVYMFNNYEWEIDDIVLTKRKGDWKGTFKVPDNCAFLAYKFIYSDTYGQTEVDNNNDLGFVYITMDKNGRKLPGGYLAWGLFRKPSMCKGVFGYFNNFTVSDTAVMLWVNKEVQFYSNNLPKFFDIYMETVKMQTGEKYVKVAGMLAEQFLNEFSDADESTYLKIRDLYKFQIQNIAKVDSLETVIKNKFPHGQLMRFTRYDQIMKIANNEKKVALIEKFLTDFPYKDWLKDKTAKRQKFIYGQAYQMLVSALFATGQYDKVISLIPDINFSTLIDIYHFNIFKAYKLKTLPLPIIEKVSDALINEMIKKENDNSYMDGTKFSPDQATRHARHLLDEKLALHIFILNDSKKYEEALAYFKHISGKGLYSNAELNNIHVDLLDKTNNSQQIQSVLENSVRKNAVTPNMFERLKQIYIGQNHSEKDYSRYLRKLKSKKQIEQEKEEIKKNLIKETYTPFKLEGKSGHYINSKDFKNKIVVLDFWATWCGPCKRSFPGMQLAVEKYKDDKKVEFYFISTLETNENAKESAIKYIEKKGYTFNLLFDEANEQTHENNKVFSTFSTVVNSSAIPRKFIVKDGYIRYTAEGYSGSPSKLLDEISYVVEILKNE